MCNCPGMIQNSYRYVVMWLWTLNRYLDNGIRPEPVGRQRIFSQAIKEQLLAAINESRQPPGRWSMLWEHWLFYSNCTLSSRYISDKLSYDCLVLTLLSWHINSPCHTCSHYLIISLQCVMCMWLILWLGSLIILVKYDNDLINSVNHCMCIPTQFDWLHATS